MKHYHDIYYTLAEKIANTRDTTRPDPEYLHTPADLADYLGRWNVAAIADPDEHDLADVRVLRDRLRAVFATKEAAVAVGILNELLDGIAVRPQVELASEGSITLRLDVDTDLPLAHRLGAEAALGLQAAIERHGIERLHFCEATPCTEVYIDTSRNHTRRYCCEQCANRHNVAAFRRRRKAETSAQ